MQEFDSTLTSFATFSVSIFVLGFASGPLLLAPLSELYARVVEYKFPNILFLGFIIFCADSKSAGMLLGFRFPLGLVGVDTITIGSGTIVETPRPRDIAHPGSTYELFPEGRSMHNFFKSS